MQCRNRNKCFKNSTGPLNTVVGYDAMLSNTSGGRNCAYGWGAMNMNLSGYDNIAIGCVSLGGNTSGQQNTVIGTFAANGNDAGSYNVALGYSALSGNSSGTYNTAIGYGTSTTVGNLTNSSAIGNGSVFTASNQMRFGNAIITSIGGLTTWTSTSDKRFKQNIKENVPGLEFIMKLRPVTYYFDISKLNDFLSVPDSMRNKQNEISGSNILQTGFVAQEVEKAAKDIGFDFNGVDKPKNDKDYYGLRYAEFTVPLVKAVQELNNKNIEQEELLNKQQSEIDEMKKQIEELKTLILQQKK